MILNPTHEITLSGLPPDVLDAYVRYKKGSRAIVAWLVQFGPASYKGARTLPIKELGALAQKVSAKVTTLPDVVDFHFRETIAARKCLSKYFRENRDETVDDFDTVNHEHFTTSLNDIYDELRKRFQSRQKSRQTPQGQHGQGGISESIRNHYDCLPVEQTQNIEGTLADLAIECTDCKEDTQMVCNGMRNSVQLVGDDVAVAIENVYLLDRAQAIYKAVEECWLEAGRSQISLIAATGATNAAWQLLLDIEHDLKVSNPEMSLSGLHRRTCIIQNNNTDSRFGHDRSKQRHELLNALEESEKSLKHYIDGHELKVVGFCASCIQKPADYVQPVEHPQTSDMKSFQIALLDNILHLVSRAGSYPSLVLSGSPCLTEIGCLLSHVHDKTCTFKCTLTMHLLTTSYKAYMRTCGKPSSVSMCRVSALRLAQQAAASITTVLSDEHAFPCQCPQTLAYHLSNLEHSLISYAKHKCWDLYFQSPWVAGTHITEMLDTLAYYGMRLLHYRHYVGSILHTYNVVQQLGGLDPVEPLERLCETFADLFFPAGGRTPVSFKNSWSRFVGARLKFKRGHKGQSHRENWCMAIPPHAARAAAGLSTSNDATQGDKVDPKFNYGRYDALVKLKQQNYRPSHQTRNAVPEKQRSLSSSRPPSSSSSVTRSSLSSVSSSADVSSQATSRTSSFSEETSSPAQQNHPLFDVVNGLNDSIKPTSSLPNSMRLSTTKLNLLAIFTTCTKIVSKISDRIHTSPEDKDNKNCICYTTTLLAGADRVVEGRKLGRLECWKKSERELIEIVKDVITEVMAEVGKDYKSWSWDL